MKQKANSRIFGVSAAPAEAAAFECLRSGGVMFEAERAKMIEFVARLASAAQHADPDSCSCVECDCPCHEDGQGEDGHKEKRCACHRCDCACHPGAPS